MDLTKEEKDALFAEFKATIEKGNKADIEKINTLIKEKMGKIDALEKKLEGSPEDPEAWKENRPFREGMKTDDVDPGGLKFMDKDGKIYEAKSLKQKLYTGLPDDFSIGKIFRAKITGDTKGLNDFEKKAIGEGIGAGGGWLISEDVSARLIDLARARSCVNQAGAVTMQMTTAELRLVKLTGDPTAYWVAEHGEISESDWTLAPINLKAMTIGVLVRSSLELLEDAENAGDQIVNSMSAAIALAVDKVALLGDGVNEPRGLDLCTDINKISMGTNGGTLTTYDEFSNAVEDCADNNADLIRAAVIFAPRTFYTLDRLKEGTTNAPLPPPQSFADLRKFVTNQIPITDTQGTCTTASKAFIGDFKNVLYGIRKQLEVEITRQGGTKTFAKCEALIRCRMRLDVAILRENHFTRIAGIKV